MTILPTVDTFATPLEIWSQRDATHAEMMAQLQATGRMPHHRVNDQLQRTITNALQAAQYMAQVGADNRVENHIDTALANSSAYSTWRRAMPSATPKSLATYQKMYPHCDFVAITNDINNIGAVLSPGQFLFHGGCWPTANGLTTTQPLSTTFCPQVALREAEHGGKAYDAGRIDLFVLRVATPDTNVFAYKRNGTNLGHEKEVLFAAGANLTLTNSTLIRNDYRVCKVSRGINFDYKEVPIYV